MMSEFSVFINFYQYNFTSLLVSCLRISKFWAFPSGSAVKNLPTNAGDTVLIPGLGGPHMPLSN